MSNETWKDVAGHEKSYQISNLGRVRSKDRCIIYSNGINRFYKGQILKKQVATNGYEIVDLSKNGKKKHHLVHRLVAQGFIPNPNNLPEVNHLDEDKTNNSVSNLHWCSVGFNRNFGSRNLKISLNRNTSAIGEKVRKKLGKEVIQVSNNGKTINRFPSIRQAEKETGFARQAISGCCNGKYNRAYGYSWRFETLNSNDSRR